MKHIPNEDDNPFQSLADLILNKVEVAVLATAIEMNDIYFWDRFGRFKKAELNDKETALNLLANFYDWEAHQEPPFKLSTFEFDWYNPLKLYGWATLVLPSFDEIRATLDEVKPPQRKSAETNRAVTMLIIIAAIAYKFKLGINNDGTASRGTSGAIEKLTEEFGSPISNDTILSILKEMPDAIERRKI